MSSSVSENGTSMSAIYCNNYNKLLLLLHSFLSFTKIESWLSLFVKQTTKMALLCPRVFCPTRARACVRACVCACVRACAFAREGSVTDLPPNLYTGKQMNSRSGNSVASWFWCSRAGERVRENIGEKKVHCTQTFEKMSYVTAHVRAEIGVSGHSLKLVRAHFLSSEQVPYLRTAKLPQKYKHY